MIIKEIISFKRRLFSNREWAFLFSPLAAYALGPMLYGGMLFAFLRTRNMPACPALGRDRGRWAGALR
jgi:hypothetical protein